MALVWVQRVSGPGSAVQAVFQLQQPGLADESLDDSDAAVVAYRAGLRRQKRTLLAIYTDLKALTAAQQSAIWTDISSGSPAKYFSDQGSEAGTVTVYDFLINQSGLTGAPVTDAKFRLVAVYVRDNVTYLVNPAFAPTVNVPGDQAG